MARLAQTGTENTHIVGLNLSKTEHMQLLFQSVGTVDALHITKTGLLTLLLIAILVFNYTCTYIRHFS